jgi:hypothetical protein
MIECIAASVPDGEFFLDLVGHEAMNHRLNQGIRKGVARCTSGYLPDTSIVNSRRSSAVCTRKTKIVRRASACRPTRSLERSGITACSNESREIIDHNHRKSVPRKTVAFLVESVLPHPSAASIRFG